MAKKDEITVDEVYKKLEEKFNIFFTPEKIRTGIVPLDLALNGYLETGSLIELAGESQTGKSTLLLHLCKNLCEKKYNIVYIDTEGSVKTDQMFGIGLEPYLSTRKKPKNNFTLIKESGYNDVEQIISEFLRAGKHKIFIIDSLTALTGDIYLDLKEERSATETRIGYDALLNSKLLQKLTALKAKYNCVFIFINQTRVDLGSFYKSYKASGGQSVKFYPDVRLFMKHKSKILDKKELITGETEIPIGAETTIEAHKSRLGFGFIPYPMTVYFGKGISNLNSYISLLPNIKVKHENEMIPLLDQPTSRTSVLHIPGKEEIKTTGGVNGLKEMIVQNADELIPLIDKYLDNYYDSLHVKSKTAIPVEQIGYDTTTERREELQLNEERIEE